MINQPPYPEDDEMARLVRSTLQAASQTSNRRLKQRMPEIPHTGRQHRRLFTGWQRQLAIICTAVVLCSGLYGFYQSNQQPAWQPIPATRIAATATFTSVPTMTQTIEGIAITETAVALETQSAAAKTPTAAATPVAALFQQTLSTHNN